MVSWFATLALAAPADAAFPGANGKIAFSQDTSAGTQIFTMNADGTNRTQLTTGPGRNVSPSWSPDGMKIVFSSNRDGNFEIYVMDANGTNQTRLTNHPSSDGARPAWSPDGTKIVFSSTRTGSGDIYSMNADGSGPVQLTFDSRDERFPAWSPDGTKIAFSGFYDVSVDDSRHEILLMNPDGSNPAPLTDTLNWDFTPDWSPDGARIAFFQHTCFWFDDDCNFEDNSGGVRTIHRDGTGDASLDYPAYDPAWSPDGSRIAIGDAVCQSSPPFFTCDAHDIVTMNPDGSGRVNLTNNPDGTDSSEPSWQPIPQSYVRPRGATPLLASLVPAYKQCTAPNSTHGAPLSFASCNPPQPASSHLTVGTPDANGEGTKAVGSLRMKTFLCPACASPLPRADVRLDVSITDVRNRDAGLSDYTGELQADAALRITDRQNTPNPGGPGPGTVSDTHFPFAVPCAATSDTSVGASCSVSTTANAVVAGAVAADQRTIWQLGRIEVYDGGASGVAGASDATLFMTQGVFIP